MPTFSTERQLTELRRSESIRASCSGLITGIPSDCSGKIEVKNTACCFRHSLQGGLSIESKSIEFLFSFFFLFRLVHAVSGGLE